MRSHDVSRDEEANEAAWEAARGAAYGAFKYGTAMVVLGGAGHALSPLYRSLTIQFKVYIWMSGTVTGSMIEADHRLRVYEARIRHERRVMRHQARMRALEEDE